MTTAVLRGIDWLLRLDYPTDTSELGLKRHYGKTVDALEMIEALEVVRVLFEDTGRVEGPIYRGEKEFDFIHDIKKAIEGHYFEGEDLKDGALRRRKYRSMVQLMLNPLVDSFNNMTHEEVLTAYNPIIDELINKINENEHDAAADDAFVVQHLISREVERRNRVQAVVDGILRLRRRKKNK